MSEEENLRLVKSLDSQDFSRKTFINALADDVKWWAAGPPSILPWAGSFRGRDGFKKWLKALRDHLKYEKWESFEWLAKGETVVQFVHAAGYAKATGRRYKTDLVRIWTIREGKVARVRSYYDTAAYVAAIRGT